MTKPRKSVLTFLGDVFSGGEGEKHDMTGVSVGKDVVYWEFRQIIKIMI